MRFYTLNDDDEGISEEQARHRTTHMPSRIEKQ